MPRVFRLFRGLGLRHLVVVSDEFEVNFFVNALGLKLWHIGYYIIFVGP